MPELYEIIHQITYRADTSAITQASEAFASQTRVLAGLQRALASMQGQYDRARASGNVAEQTRLTAAMDRLRTAIQARTAATREMLLTDRNLQQGLQQEVGIINGLTVRLNALREAQRSATTTTEIRNFGREIANVERDLARVSGSRNGILGQMRSGFSSGLGVAGAFGVANLVSSGIGALTAYLDKASELAKQTEGVEVAFRRLDNPNLLKNLQSATRGTVSDLELMKSAVQFQNYGLPVDKLATALQFARTRARETGQSVEYLVQSITTGIGRQSPLILDNLGLNAKRVRDEFAKMGNFADAAFKIIQEESAKSGTALDSYADRLDRVNTSIENQQAKLGEGVNKFKSYALATGSDIVSLFSGDDIGYGNTAFDRLSAAYDDQEVTDAAYQEQLAAKQKFEDSFLAITDNYANADNELRSEIVSKVEGWQSILLAGAARYYGADSEQYAAYANNLLSMAERLWSQFAKLRGESTKTISPDNMDVSGLEKTISRNKELIDSYTTSDLKINNNLVERNRLLKENKDNQERINDIQGKEDKVSAGKIKSASAVGNRQEDLEQRLQETLAGLRQKGLEIREKSEVESAEKIERINLRPRDTAILKLENDIDQARRKGLLTANVNAVFENIRVEINANANAQIEQDTDKFYETQRAKLIDFFQSLNSAELSSLKALSGLPGYSDISTLRRIAQLETQAQLDELQKRYAANVRTAQETAQGLDIMLKLGEDFQQQSNIIKEQGLRREYDVYSKHYQSIREIVSHELQEQVNVITRAQNNEQEALQASYDAGETSYRKYLKRRAEIQANFNSESNLQQQAQITEEIERAMQLIGNAAVSGLPSEEIAQLQDKLESLRAELAKLKAAATDNAWGDSPFRRFFSEVEDYIDVFNVIASAVADGLNMIEERTQRSAERELKIREKRLEDARILAERGNTEALKSEQEKIAELERIREASARRQAIVNSSLALSYAIAGVAKAALEGGGAFAPVTIAAFISALVAGYGFVSSLDPPELGLKEGVIDLQGPGTSKSDSINARLSVGESVMTAEETQNYKPYLMAMREGTFSPMLRNDFFNSSVSGFASKADLRELSAKLDEVVDAVYDTQTKVDTRVTKDGIYQAVDTVAKRERRRWAS